MSARSKPLSVAAFEREDMSNADVMPSSLQFPILQFGALTQNDKHFHNQLWGSKYVPWSGRWVKFVQWKETCMGRRNRVWLYFHKINIQNKSAAEYEEPEYK